MKVNWIKEKENLGKLITENVSYLEIGRKYGVSGNAVKKAAIRLGFDIPKRREINPNETFGKGKNDVCEICKYCGKEFKHAAYLGNVDFCSDECKNKFNEEKKFNMSSPNVKEFYNKKNVGDLGEQIAIGELGKYGLQVVIPLSDNLPFDFAVFINNKFYKCQVKSTANPENGFSKFRLISGNGYLHKYHKYTEDEVDVFVLCDLNNIYLFKTKDVLDKNEITIRYSIPLSGHRNNITYASDCIISLKRIKEIFD
jgi:hypothetical protein